MIDIHAILERASKLKIAVIGDYIEDRYIIGSTDRVSPEAPVLVLNNQEEKVCMGGAGNVFMNLLNLGADVHLYCNHLGMPRVEEHILERMFCNPFPHAVKTRLMSGQHHLLRVDNEVPYDQIPWETFKDVSWWKHLQEHFADYDRIVLCDYSKGTLSDSMINAVMELQAKYTKSGWKVIPVIVDAKKDFNRFDGAYIIKCNSDEFRKFGPIRFENIQANIRIVTSGDKGISWYTPITRNHMPGFSVNIVDVCGAGDTVTAILATVEEGPNLNELCHLANIAASEVCRHPGVHAITKEELINRYNEVKGFIMQGHV